MQPYSKVLLLGGDEDWSVLEEMLAQYAVVTGVGKVSDALALLKEEDYDVLFCQGELADGTWRTVLEEIQNRRLEVPVIVFCHCGGEREWIEVLEAGAFDLLVPPYSAYQTMAVLEHALASRRRIADCCLSA